MSVTSAPVRQPSSLAVVTNSCASSMARSTSGMNAPLPVLTSSTRAPAPVASFFDRMLATISGSDSTVPVWSRSA